MQLYLYDICQRLFQKFYRKVGIHLEHITYKSPKAGKLVIIEDTILTWVYQQEGLPQMTVNCIVGMNGVGKSKKKLKMVLNR